jgi:hypothetical protein
VLAFGLLLSPGSARASSCTDVPRVGPSKRPACPLAPKAPPAIRPARGAHLFAGMGPVRIDEPRIRIAALPHVTGGALPNKRELSEGDLAERDCYGSLCGPQSATLRVGMLYLERRPTFSPMIGGLGAVAGAIALQLKPGPRPERAPSPSLDGWAAVPRGLKPAGPPFAFLPLISINDRQGGLRFLVSW